MLGPGGGRAEFSTVLWENLRVGPPQMQKVTIFSINHHIPLLRAIHLTDGERVGDVGDVVTCSK
jgi:hypothetical protein